MSNPIWEAVESRKSKTADDIFKALKNVPIFSDLNPKEMNEIEKIIHRREYKKGEPIFRMGDPGLGMYIIIKGLINIVGSLVPSGFYCFPYWITHNGTLSFLSNLICHE